MMTVLGYGVVSARIIGADCLFVGVHDQTNWIPTVRLNSRVPNESRLFEPISHEGEHLQ